MAQDTVMVVDDEPGILDTYSAWLSEEYDVVTASDGDEALSKLHDDVSVVLLDRRMPGMSGRDVLDEMHDRDHDARVAIVTAVEPDFEIVDMGFDAYLVKPVTKEELVEVVEELLNRVEYSEMVLEYHSLVSKKVLLESKKTDEQLDNSDEYAKLIDRLEDVESRADELFRGMSTDGYKALVRDIQDRA
ncbi:MAG: response regulator [Halobacteria archaeon]